MTGNCIFEKWRTILENKNLIFFVASRQGFGEMAQEMTIVPKKKRKKTCFEHVSSLTTFLHKVLNV